MTDEAHEELVSALHDVMLPASIPVLREIELAARFCLPDDADDGIGSWFDALVLDDGRLALVVGEVAGAGLVAAATIGQVRAVVRAGLVRWGEVAETLELADAHARHSVDARGATVTIAVLDPHAHVLTWATAGHQPPVLAGPAGLRPLLDPTGTGPLGGRAAREATRLDLAGTETVLLASVPLGSELPGSAGSPGSRGPCPAETDGGPDHLVDAVLQRSSGSHAATVVAARLRARPSADLQVEVAGGADGARAARASLTVWLESIPTPPADVMALVHAVSELVANAVEHAYVHLLAPGPVRVVAHLDHAGEVCVEVRDRGRWRVPGEDVSRGRGLAMAAGLVDHLDVDSHDDGTTVRLRHRLSRPVHLDRAPQQHWFGRASVELTHHGAGTVELSGPFGHDDVDRVGTELLLASRGGTRELHVHLAEVTHLSTSAVQLLADLVTADADDQLPDAGGPRVLLHAPGGSAAQRLLDRARVPHVAS